MTGLRRQVVYLMVAALTAASWAAIIAYPHAMGRASLVESVENALFNLRSSSLGILAAAENVTILAIDDATLEQANPLDSGRAVLARLVETARSAGAAVVTLDLLLTDEGSPEGDAALADALGALPTVIAAGGNVVESGGLQGIPGIRETLSPLPRFAAQSEVGIANIVTDASGVPRHIPIAFMTDQGLRPSLAARTAAFFTGTELRLAGESLTLGNHSMPLDHGFQMPLRIAGPAGTIPTVSALDVLNGEDLDILAGKAVIIGVTATGLGDRFPTPFDPDLPGVEVMARAIDQLISGDVLRRDSTIRRLDMLCVILLAPLFVLLVLLLPLTYGLTIGLSALALWYAGIWLAFAAGIWLNAALPLAGVIPPMALAALFRYRFETQAAARSNRAVTALKKFQSPLLAEQIARDPGFLSTPENRRLIICFIDLSGFTQISQLLGAQKTETVLKGFHRLITTRAQEHGGGVLNFMGDGALLVYGIDGRVTQAGDAALQAARDIMEGLHDLSCAQQITPPLTCRIGLHHGEVVLSRLGGDQHQQLTISGDSVNLSSRLLEIAKAQGAVIAATETFCDLLSPGAAPLPDQTTLFPIRGRQGNIRISLWRR